MSRWLQFSRVAELTTACVGVLGHAIICTREYSFGTATNEIKCRQLAFNIFKSVLKVEVFESHKYWREVFESCFSHGLKIAVAEFLKTNSDFVVDQAIDEKLLIFVAPGGYLKRIK